MRDVWGLAVALGATALIALVALRSGDLVKEDPLSAGAAPLPVLHQNGRQLVNETGSPVYLYGTNYNTVSFITRIPFRERTFDAIAGAGLNAVRLPIAWQFLEPEPGSIREDYLADIESAVRMAAKNHLYVIIVMVQWHVSPCFGRQVYGNGFPGWFVRGATGSCRSSVRFWNRFWRNGKLGTAAGRYAGRNAWEAFADSWRPVVRRVGRYSNVVGWDILNEPHRGDAISEEAFNTFVLPSFYARIAKSIRRWEAPERPHVLIVEGENGDIKPSMARPALQNFALSPHAYAPAMGVTCQSLARLIHRGLDKASAWDVPTIFGEIGTFSAMETQTARAADTLSRIVAVNGSGWLWWDSAGEALTPPTTSVIEALRGNAHPTSRRECVKNVTK